MRVPVGEIIEPEDCTVYYAVRYICMYICVYGYIWRFNLPFSRRVRRMMIGIAAVSADENRDWELVGKQRRKRSYCGYPFYFSGLINVGAPSL